MPTGFDSLYYSLLLHTTTLLLCDSTLVLLYDSTIVQLYCYTIVLLRLYTALLIQPSAYFLLIRCSTHCTDYCRQITIDYFSVELFSSSAAAAAAAAG